MWTPQRARRRCSRSTRPTTRSARAPASCGAASPGVTLTSLLLFVVLVAPLVLAPALARPHGQRQREALLERAVDASDAERRRIAASLHDGPVQDLAATSFVIAGRHRPRRGRGTQRAGPGAARRLGLGAHEHPCPAVAARRHLSPEPGPRRPGGRAHRPRPDGARPRPRGPGRPGHRRGLRLDAEGERLVYRVAQETLRNAAKHAAPCTVRVSRAAPPTTGRPRGPRRASTTARASTPPGALDRSASTATSACSCSAELAAPARRDPPGRLAPLGRAPTGGSRVPRHGVRRGRRAGDPRPARRRPRDGARRHRRAARLHRRPGGRGPGGRRRGGGRRTLDETGPTSC